MSAAYLVLLGREVDWGAPVDRTARLASSAEAEAFSNQRDLEELGFRAGDPSAPERILLLRSASGETAWRARARMELAEIDEPTLCELPTALLSSHELPFKGLVVREGHRPLLVLEPEALAPRAQSL